MLATYSTWKATERFRSGIVVSATHFSLRSSLPSVSVFEEIDHAHSIDLVDRSSWACRSHHSGGALQLSLPAVQLPFETSIHIYNASTTLYKFESLAVTQLESLHHWYMSVQLLFFDFDLIRLTVRHHESY